jgi:hypothetical protein
MMKVTIVAITMALLGMSSMAQEEHYDCVFCPHPGTTGYNLYAGLTFEHHASITNTKPGVEAGVIFNRMFVCGAYGQGTTGNFGIRYYNGDIHNIMFGEGGVFAGYVAGYSKPIHFGGTLKIGYIALVADDQEMKLFKDVEPIAEDGGMVFHPEVFTETNVTKHIKVRLGAGYSFNSLDKESVICNKDLDSWTMNLSVLAGNFAK